MIALALLAALAAQAGAADAILTARARSNAALAAHDFVALSRSFGPDYTILPGSLGAPLTQSELAARLTVAFADPAFVTYVRAATKVTVSSSGRRAAETGTWVGTWRKPDGTMRLSGIYQAMWMPYEGEWRLRNESFVTLRCVGSKACAELD